ncbi:hypothetical protein SAMN04489712_110116 [Thermomonospora echinospora]|uniref:Uncharacterized protein n=1 Tax=Thermomonospora echinospora TaxID=1992 RepID=A0A1H6CKF5_9ACTN|nr:hypothetical protein [Thermomonospora echinospora]SEG73491.1 hypothetical protein SAMN04489712_110116 [Thermomonospora echinospora]
MSIKTLEPGAGGVSPPVHGERPRETADPTSRYTRTDQGQVRPLDGEEYLRGLRAEFPHVGFVADIRAGVWMAVKGKDLFLRADSGAELCEQLLAALGRH